MTLTAQSLFTLVAGQPAPFQQVFAKGADHRLRVNVTQGTGPWHRHPNTSETFIVLQGELTLDFRDGPSVTLKVGDTLSVPQGVSHRSRATAKTISISAETLHPQVYLEEVQLEES